MSKKRTLPKGKYSVRQASNIIGVTGQAIRDMIRTGKLPATQFGRTWVIEAKTDIEITLKYA